MKCHQLSGLPFVLKGLRVFHSMQSKVKCVRNQQTGLGSEINMKIISGSSQSLINHQKHLVLAIEFRITQKF